MHKIAMYFYLTVLQNKHLYQPWPNYINNFTLLGFSYLLGLTACIFSNFHFTVYTIGNMLSFPLKGTPTGPHTHMYRLLQRRTTELNYTPTVLYCINPIIYPCIHTPNHNDIIQSPQVGTISAPYFTPSTTPVPLPAPSSKPAPSSPIVNEQEDTRVDGSLHIQIEGMEFEPSSKCVYIMRKSFIDRVDSNGYKWVTLSEETKQFYWEEFQKKFHWFRW